MTIRYISTRTDNIYNLTSQLHGVKILNRQQTNKTNFLAIESTTHNFEIIISFDLIK